MTIIDFITLKSSLVSLLQGLCSSNPCRFKFLVLRSHRIHICRDLVHLDSSGSPGVSSLPLGSHPSKSLCVSTHMHPHTLQPSSKYREDTDNAPISSRVKNNPPRQQQMSFIDWLNPSLLFPQHSLTNCAYTSACAHPATRVSINMYTIIKNIHMVYTPVHALVLKTPV